MEYIDIVDEQGNPTGEKVERSIAHSQGIRHRTAHIWIVRKVNGRYQVLMQKRAMNKESFPGMFDTSSAGHIQAGDEPLESALREFHEELGIRAQPQELEFAGNFRISYEKEFYGKMFRDNEIAFVYIYSQPVDETKLVLQKEEVDEKTPTYKHQMSFHVATAKYPDGKPDRCSMSWMHKIHTRSDTMSQNTCREELQC